MQEGIDEQDRSLSRAVLDVLTLQEIPAVETAKDWEGKLIVRLLTPSDPSRIARNGADQSNALDRGGSRALKARRTE